MSYDLPTQNSSATSGVRTTQATDQAGNGPQNDLLYKLLAERKVAREFQLRKHPDWLENYELYRNKVRTNRLTQRQPVNIPLMKETVKTLLSKIDDPPNVDWKEKSGDEMKQIIYQQVWNERFRKDKFEWKDMLDKKNVLIYGLSTKMLNLCDDGVDVSVLDCYDVVYDPMMDPTDIETARFIIRQNLFRPLRDIMADERYSEEGKEALKTYVYTTSGLIQSGATQKEYQEKMQRLRSMGVKSVDFPTFAAGDVMVNLCEHYTNIWDIDKQKFVRRVVVYANDSITLLNETLDNLTGVDCWPFVLWSEDLEASDVYPDSVADMVRVPNKVINVWFSQQAENRTLQNFQMHWYDATDGNYKPQTYTPGPGVMLPAPGDPNKTIMPVNINGLDETFNAINFLTAIVERGTGATAIEKGSPEQGTQTLGEIQILQGSANERATSMAKFYRGSWYELACKWDKMMQANPPRKMKLYKTGPSGKVYEKVVYPSDWKSQAGYEPVVSSTSEQEAEQTKTLQKFLFVMQQFPNNSALRKVAQKRELESLDLTPDELKQIQDAETQMEQQAIAQSQIQPTPQPTAVNTMPTLAPAQ